MLSVPAENFAFKTCARFPQIPAQTLTVESLKNVWEDFVLTFALMSLVLMAITAILEIASSSQTASQMLTVNLMSIARMANAFQ